jgi:uncharacterized protein (TIGR00299 family) protein
MTLASLMAAGADMGEVAKSLESLGVSFDLEAESVEVNGVGATKAKVSYPEEHIHRTFRDVRAMIEDADLPERASSRAVEAFRLLAVAEGKVHGKAPEEVAFHEVGAADSIVDMVGSCLALEILGADTVSCGPLPMGSGVVNAAHGSLPIPGPATLEVLEGSKIRWPDESHEMTTPTGAALMRAFTGGDFTESAPPMTLKSVGYGAGTARFESVPNLLRAVVGEVEGAVGDIEVIEANVDDSSGEILGSAVERLLEGGALDAWLEPILMKRGRGAYKICSLAKSGDVGKLAHLMMRETGTLGVRHYSVARTVAERRIETVELAYGKCRIKIGRLDGEDFIVSPEYEDAAKLAKKANLPLPRVYSDARNSLKNRGSRKTNMPPDYR